MPRQACFSSVAWMRVGWSRGWRCGGGEATSPPPASIAATEAEGEAKGEAAVTDCNNSHVRLFSLYVLHAIVEYNAAEGSAG